MNELPSRKEAAVEEIARLLGVTARAGIGSREPGWLIDLAVTTLGLDGLAGQTKVRKAQLIVELSGRDWTISAGGDAAPSGGGLNTTGLEKLRDALADLLGDSSRTPEA